MIAMLKHIFRKLTLIILILLMPVLFNDLAFSSEYDKSPKELQIEDLKRLPQDPFFYLRENYNKRLIYQDDQLEYLSEFRKLYFSPWSQSKPRHGIDVQDWIFRHFAQKKGYAENLRPRSDQWLDDLKTEANLTDLGRLNQKAVTVRETNLRLLPTNNPFFYNPDLPGEGYPFDHIQNSAVHTGEPIFVSHLSVTGEWAWSETSYAAGWIKIHDLAFVDDEFMNRWTSAPLGVFIEDNIPVKDLKDSFHFMGNTGTILPVKKKYISKTGVIIPVRDTDGNVREVTSLVNARSFKKHPVSATGWNIAMVCNSFMEKPYGWGGYLGNRDCSATIRDIFLPFGIWLPRNSAAQSESGINLSLKKMGDRTKSLAILREGKPFITLVNKRGHVMLYLGSYRGEPVILHNTWGLKTLDKGLESRKIIGKTVITSLKPGKELVDIHPEGLLIDSITGITLLGGIK